MNCIFDKCFHSNKMVSLNIFHAAFQCCVHECLQLVFKASMLSFTVKDLLNSMKR